MNPYLETLEEVATCNGLAWDTKAQLNLFCIFLKDKKISQCEWGEFLEREATEQLCQED